MEEQRAYGHAALVLGSSRESRNNNIYLPENRTSKGISSVLTEEEGLEAVRIVRWMAGWLNI